MNQWIIYGFFLAGGLLLGIVVGVVLMLMKLSTDRGTGEVQTYEDWKTYVEGRGKRGDDLWE